MNTIGSRFVQCRERGEKALIPFMTAGFPSARSFTSLLNAFAESGADIIEVGIPFSDPLADGPTIQFSSQQALASGVTVGKTLDLIARAGTPENVPLVIMSYYNPLLRYGLARFARDAREVGVRGLIVPDMIVEESTELTRICRQKGIDQVQLLAPTSPPERQRRILRQSRGFVYLVSVTGITGARKTLPRRVDGWIKNVKRQTHLPIAVGFGISGPRQARRIARVADGVIVGSAIINILRNGSSPRAAIRDVREFVRQMKSVLSRK